MAAPSAGGGSRQRPASCLAQRLGLRARRRQRLAARAAAQSACWRLLAIRCCHCCPAPQGAQACACSHPGDATCEHGRQGQAGAGTSPSGRTASNEAQDCPPPGGLGAGAHDHGGARWAHGLRVWPHMQTKARGFRRQTVRKGRGREGPAPRGRVRPAPQNAPNRSPPSPRGTPRSSERRRPWWTGGVLAAGSGLGGGAGGECPASRADARARGGEQRRTPCQPMCTARPIEDEGCVQGLARSDRCALLCNPPSVGIHKHCMHWQLAGRACKGGSSRQ